MRLLAARELSREHLRQVERLFTSVRLAARSAGQREALYRSYAVRVAHEREVWRTGLTEVADRLHATLDIDRAILYAMSSWTPTASSAKKLAQTVLRRSPPLGLVPPNSDELRRRLAAGLNRAAWTQGAVTAYVGMALETGTAAGQMSLDLLGIEKTWAWADPRRMARDLFQVRGSKVVQGMYGQHIDRLQKLIVEATDPRHPHTLQEVRGTIRKEWPALQRYQVDRIARTETAAIWTATSANAYAVNGITQFESVIAHGPTIGVESEDPCPICIEAAAEIHDMSGDLPPWHPNCFPAGTMVSVGHVRSTYRRWYEGEMVEVHTRGNRRLSATPNHPVLTDKGWIEFNLLQDGDKLICAEFIEPEGTEWPRASTMFNEHQMPARIEDVVDTFARSSFVATAAVPVAPEHFHGDGADSQVAVVSTDRFLYDDGRNAPIMQPSLHKQRGWRRAGTVFLARLCTSAHCLLTSRYVAHCDISTSDLCSTLVGSHSRLGLRAGAKRDARITERTSDSVRRNAKISGQFSRATPDKITLDEIVQIRRYPFSGYVYNLETQEGTYSANGVLVHNCRCEIVPVLEDEAGVPWLPPDEPWTGSDLPVYDASTMASIPIPDIANVLPRPYLLPAPVAGGDTVPARSFAAEEHERSLTEQRAPDELRAMLTSASNRISGLRTRLKRESLRGSPNSEKIAGLRDRLEREIAERGRLKQELRRAGEGRAPGAEAAGVGPASVGRIDPDPANLRAFLNSWARGKRTRVHLSDGSTRELTYDPLDFIGPAWRNDKAGEILPSQVRALDIELDGRWVEIARTEVPLIVSGVTPMPGNLTPALMRTWFQESGVSDGILVRRDSGPWLRTTDGSGGIHDYGNANTEWAMFRHEDVVVQIEIKPGTALDAPSLGKLADSIKKRLDATLPLVNERAQRLELIVMAKGSSPDLAYWRKQYHWEPHTSIMGQGGNGRISMWEGASIRGPTFDHELGHILGKSDGGPLGMSLWQNAQRADAQTSAGFSRFRTFVEGRAVIVGKEAVTDYGHSSVREDWAESVRLYIQDKMHGSIGSASSPGSQFLSPVRFADLFPARAHLIDEWLAGTRVRPPTRSSVLEEIQAKYDEMRARVKQIGNQLSGLNTRLKRFGEDDTRAEKLRSRIALLVQERRTIKNTLRRLTGSS